MKHWKALKIKGKHTFLWMLGLVTWLSAQPVVTWDVGTKHYGVYANVTLNRIEGDNLLLSAYGQPLSIKIEQITFVIEHRPSKAGLGLLGGALFGGLTAHYLARKKTENYSTFPIDVKESVVRFYSVVGTLSGALLGWWIGKGASTITYPLTAFSVEKKRALLEILVLKAKQSAQLVK